MKVIIIGLLLAGSMFAVWTYAFPAWDRIVIARREISAIRDIEQKVDKIKKTRDEIISRYNSIGQEKKDRLDQLVPAQLSQEDIFIFFNNIVTNSGMRFESVGLSSVGGESGGESGGGRKTLGFDMKASGSYTNFRALLNNLETNVRLIDIDSIGISEDAQKIFSLSLKGKTYYANER